MIESLTLACSSPRPRPWSQSLDETGDGATELREPTDTRFHGNRVVELDSELLSSGVCPQVKLDRCLAQGLSWDRSLALS